MKTKLGILASSVYTLAAAGMFVFNYQTPVAPGTTCADYSVPGRQAACEAAAVSHSECNGALTINELGCNNGEIFCECF